ncbi:MAG: hypothetical protein ACNYWU_05555 [Desulfobacterales bacterium]
MCKCVWGRIILIGLMLASGRIRGCLEYNESYHLFSDRINPPQADQDKQKSSDREGEKFRMRFTCL